MDHYRVLEISRDASKEEIKRAWKRLAELYHPDKVRHLGPRLLAVAEEEMRKLNLAKETLLDDGRREEYDLMLSEARRPPRVVPPSMVDDERPAVRVEVEPVDDAREGISISKKPYTQPGRGPPVEPVREVRVVVEAMDDAGPDDDPLEEFVGTPVCDAGRKQAPDAANDGPRVTRFVPMSPLVFDSESEGKRRRKKRKRGSRAADAGTAQPMRI